MQVIEETGTVTRTGRGGPRPNSGRKKGSSPRVLTREPVQAFAKRCRESAPEVLEILLKIVRNDQNPPAARVSAAGMILDRGFGKVPEVIDINGDLSVNANFKFESVEQFRATIEAQGIPEEFWPPFVRDLVDDEVEAARRQVLELVANRNDDEPAVAEDEQP